jgi:hypothetical protein
MSRAWLVLAVVSLASCGAKPDSAQKVESRGQQDVRVAHLPPSAKDIIDAVIASGGVALSVSPTCKSVGTEPSDATIGRYLAGFMAELSSPEKKNWIETQVEPGTAVSGEPVSICRLTLRHVDGDDRWGWGVQFHVRTSDGLVLANSFTCTGAG